ncbi:MAG TPA: diguanylate cyclase [Candidatus Limnocylindrales bacterium]
MALERLGGHRFDEDDERRFVERQAELLARRAVPLYVAVAVGLVLFTAWDALIDPAGAVRSGLVRLAGGGAVLAGLAWLMARPVTARRYAIASSCGTIAAIVTVGLALASLRAGFRFGVAGLTTVAIGLGILQPRAHEAVLDVVVGLTIAVAVMLAIGTPALDEESALWFIGLAVFATWLISSLLEASARQTFALELRLAHEARHDPLTGVRNRRALAEDIRSVLGDGGREARAALVLVDLDRFKRINDRFGHDAGDDALRAFVDACRPLLRPDDLFGRLGGEEFVIVLPGADLAEGERVAERLRVATRDLTVSSERGAIHFTASFAVTAAGGRDSLETLVRRADGALYRAKRNGRDRVEAA